MKVYRDQGIVLRKRPMGEKDELVILLSKHHGKRAFMSYGSRDPRSRKSGLLELSNEVAFQARESKSLPVLQQVQMFISRGFDTVEGDESLEAFYRSAELLKLTDRLIQDEQNVQSVYVDLSLALNLVMTDGVVERYWVRMLEDLGFLPDWKHCSSCGEALSTDEQVVFSLEHRGFDHQHCTDQMSEVVSVDLLKIMNYFQKASFADTLRLQTDQRSLRSIRQVMEQITVEH